MRLVFSRWILLILLITLIFSFPLSVARAAEEGSWLDEAYPTPFAAPALEVNSDTAYGLIVGAAVIVIVIFAGVVLRRSKS